MLTEQEKIKHLYYRAAFGCSIHKMPYSVSLQANIDALLAPQQFQSLHIISQSEVDAVKAAAKSKGKEAKVEVKKMLKENIVELNEMWLNEMIHTSAQLQEKLALFWHGHFACRTPNPYFNQQYLDIIRKNALGNFKTLLIEISKTPAMLQFLNNQQNKKDHPNENFAREVMELFTLGRGNYTEQDIKEAARAFTGYGFDALGEFKFRKAQHDFGNKTFFGKTGNFDGDDILEMITQKPECAYFITKKLYQFFVHDESVDENLVQDLAQKFYQSNYNIKQLMSLILKADWFYDVKNVGNKIKSPTELIANTFRLIPTTFDKPNSILFMQRTLGQVLLNPPNVAGWKGGKSWIDSSSLLFRMRLPQIIFYDEELDFSPKAYQPEMGDIKMKMMDEYVKKLASKKLSAKVDWSKTFVYFSNKKDSWNEIVTAVLPCKIDGAIAKIVTQNADISTKENEIKSKLIHAMSLPEFQLC